MKKTNLQLLLLTVVFAGVSLLGGCGDNNKDNKPQQVTSAATPSVEVKPVGAQFPVADQLGPRYDATLAEGIDFKKDGYPNFLAEVSGMSGREDWGRWTDADKGLAAKFRFKQPLPEKFTLELQAHAFGPNIGVPIKVRVGNVEKTFTAADTSKVFRLDFAGVKGADTIEIIPPKPTSPAELKVNSDPRKLGVGLVDLKILE